MYTNGKIAVDYSEGELKLPNGEVCHIFQVMRVSKSDGVSPKEIEDFLMEFENRLDTSLVSKYGLEGAYPHFYIQCPYDESLDDIIRLFPMTFIDDMSILLYPEDCRFDFQGEWADYLLFKKMRNERVLVVNAEGTETDESMIDYWQRNTNYNFAEHGYTCPATMKMCMRDELDGAHVEIVGHHEMGQFITPLHNGFNRSHSRRVFPVKPEYLVVAP